MQCLLRNLRLRGEFIPIHANTHVNLVWLPTKSLADLVCNAGASWQQILDPAFARCVCHNFSHEWPRLDLGFGSHICAMQFEVPVPEHLAWITRLPATTRVMPDRAFVYASIRNSLCALVRRIRPQLDASWLIKQLASSLADDWLASLPSSSKDFLTLTSCRQFARLRSNLWCQYLDHARTTLCFLCPALVHQGAVRTYSVHPSACATKYIEWLPFDSIQNTLDLCARIPGLDPHLQPHCISKVRPCKWQLGMAQLLPKWKAPGLKFRPVVSKCFEPTHDINSCCCRSIEFLIDAFLIHNPGFYRFFEHRLSS